MESGRTTDDCCGFSIAGPRSGFDALAKPVRACASLGPFAVRSANKTGTDHLSFVGYGVPAWNFDQMSRGYGHTHHSQVDTFDHAIESDLTQAAAVMAVTAYKLANYPVLLARGKKTPVTPLRSRTPSPGLAGIS